MAYTEKVSLNGTALSFLLYECMNSVSSQEGFLIGDVTSEITNHISDSQNDSARLDTQIIIRTVLPLPSVSLFYLPTGTIKEDVLSELLSNVATEVVGWYKYRKNSNIKPTFRDKLISKGLQKYFEKYHGKKTFVSCNLSSKTSSVGSTHTVIYRFGKINCFDMYEYVEDVTANLGEKLTGYKKANKVSPHCIFNKIVKESNVQTNNTNHAILSIQEAVDVRLIKEAKIAAENESTIRELEAEIKQMSDILADKQVVDLTAAYNRISEEKLVNRDVEMAKACIEALKTPTSVDILSIPNVNINSNSTLSNSENSIQIVENIENELKDRNPSPIAIASSSSPSLNYASALKKSSELASTSASTFKDTKSKNNSDDLITFDVEEKHQKSILINDNLNIGGSSPEY
ncbi:BRCA1-A complex subunit Abraxas 1-like [Melitaea cinxia]|uniref:BRCA1-A complex subunit Abraxas 1-like n=1 Tax=Melitaea cinxia TaxID=113334 RepID=UPI001E273A61|nr:BRCA1-A complex subunit Abraxas 1-like [Melitaea cinxia]XP_045449561.1 BRCA1-A complex subunit Abraxas 1-like [Melitaea cinxia]